jgi:acyl-CoA reductase-like NAD-dependent aldehyde dehydrogenase
VSEPSRPQPSSLEPSSLEPPSPVPDATWTPLGDVPALVARCRIAATAYAAREIDARVRLLLRFQGSLLRRGERLARAVTDETGKPEAEAWLHEIVPTADLGEYWTREGPSHLAATEPVLDALSYPGKRALVERQPRGVVALITPWNFPLALPLRTLFPALLAGNGVVWKPSEHTTATARVVLEAAEEVYGRDLVCLVEGEGEHGAAVIGANVDAVVFTGSVATGRAVAHAAADALVPVSLELGGKDAAVVLDDADVERTARGILWGALVNSGQNCAGIERVYATSAIVGPLRTRLGELAKTLVPGRDYGPLTTDAQLAVVERHVEDARQRGAEVVAGGDRLDRAGRWFAPTVLGDTVEDAPIMCDETFGPVVVVVGVADEEAAIEHANQGRFGLTASVWTRDLRRGERVAKRLRAGVVMVNNHGFSGAVPALPWSGVGESGYGVTNSPHALDILTRPRATVVDARRAKRELWWHPYTPALVQIGRSMAILRGGGGFGARIQALVGLLRALLTRWR